MTGGAVRRDQLTTSLYATPFDEPNRFAWRRLPRLCCHCLATVARIAL